MTPNQIKALRYIGEFARSANLSNELIPLLNRQTTLGPHRTFPTAMQICEHCGFRNLGTVEMIIGRFAQKQLIARNRNGEWKLTPLGEDIAEKLTPPTPVVTGPVVSI